MRHNLVKLTLLFVLYSQFTCVFEVRSLRFFTCTDDNFRSAYHRIKYRRLCGLLIQWFNVLNTTLKPYSIMLFLEKCRATATVITGFYRLRAEHRRVLSVPLRAAPRMRQEKWIFKRNFNGRKHCYSYRNGGRQRGWVITSVIGGGAPFASLTMSGLLFQVNKAKWRGYFLGASAAPD